MLNIRLPGLRRDVIYVNTRSILSVATRSQGGYLGTLQQASK